MTRCCVPLCTKSGSHRFPKDKKIRSMWLKAIRCEKLVPTDATRICRNHFTNDDYLSISEHTGLKHQHNYLHKSAVPSIFRWTGSGQSAKKIAPAKSSKIKSSLNETKHNSEGDNKRCCVPQCNSKSGEEKITLHSFPKNESLKRKWAKILNTDKEITKNMMVCSLHFKKVDFVSQDDHSKTIMLRRNAIPLDIAEVKTKNLNVNSSNNIIMDKNNIKVYKTMSDTGNDECQDMPECRACLERCVQSKHLCDIFQPWSPPWIGMGATIAEDLAKLANIQITSEMDMFPSSICQPCYQSLLKAATFIAKVRYCDLMLKKRYGKLNDIKTEEELDKGWPKPIQIDKNINGSVYQNTADIDIKQEVLSDEEYSHNSYMEADLLNLDIKVEPEELVTPVYTPDTEPPLMQITINGTMSLDPASTDNNSIFNGIVQNGEQHLEVMVKDEPISDDEDLVLDLSLECLLCTKKFNSVHGLKAHVIAHHSYKTVKRKTSGNESPEKKRSKHICEICRRSFTTPTDLMVHESCHYKYSCYGCHAKFDTFELLTKHRKRCKANNKEEIQRPKTLEDVIRPQLENSIRNTPSSDTNTTEDIKIPTSDDIKIPTTEDIKIPTSEDIKIPTSEDQDTINSQEDTSNSSMKLHLEIHSAKEPESIELNSVVKVETLCDDVKDMEEG